MRARNPEQRLRAFLAGCSGKKECPYTNAPQPHYKMDGMKIMAEFPKPKNDDDILPDTIDRKQVRGTVVLKTFSSSSSGDQALANRPATSPQPFTYQLYGLASHS